LKKKPIDQIDFHDHWEFQRKDKTYTVPEYRYNNLVISSKLFNSIQSMDLKEVAKQNGVEFVKDAEGKFRLKGKEYIVLQENRWHNEKSNTRGGTLEFINFCNNESWTKTLSRFDDSGIALSVGSLVGEKTPSFKSFYVSPKFKELKERKKVDLESLFQEPSKILKSLSRAGRVKVLPGEKAKFYSQDFPNSSLTVHKRKNGWVSRQKNGINGTFFKRIRNAKDPLIIFEDPIQFVSPNKLVDRILNDRKPVNFIVSSKPLDQFLSENSELLKSASKVRIVPSREQFSWGQADEERQIESEDRSRWEKQYGLKYGSIDELFKELILGRTI
jgi:hypothetical protein